MQTSYENMNLVTITSCSVSETPLRHLPGLRVGIFRIVPSTPRPFSVPALNAFEVTSAWSTDYRPS